MSASSCKPPYLSESGFATLPQSLYNGFYLSFFRRISPTQLLFQEGFAANAPQLVVNYGKESMDSSYKLQTYSGAYPVLPPIGGSNNSDTELCSARPEEATNIIQRSSSEGYLAQLEKQKQILAKTTYKVCVGEMGLAWI